MCLDGRTPKYSPGPKYYAKKKEERKRKEIKINWRSNILLTLAWSFIYSVETVEFHLKNAKRE
jgi:hypothetical protein